MANKLIQLKNGNDNLYPNIGIANSDGVKIKCNGSFFYIGTMVVTFTNGECDVDISSFGFSDRPKAALLTSNNGTLALRYDYDNSSATIMKLISTTSWNGLLRISYLLLS